MNRARAPASRRSRVLERVKQVRSACAFEAFMLIDPDLICFLFIETGYYGATAGLTAATCSGQCTAGYYCLAGSTTPTQHACPAVCRLFCPRVCSSRDVVAGHVGSSGRLDSFLQRIMCASLFASFRLLTIVVCCVWSGSPNYYCPAGSSSSTAYPCNAACLFVVCLFSVMCTQARAKRTVLQAAVQHCRVCAIRASH